MRKLIAISVVFAGLIFAPAANAAIPSVFGGDVSCAVQGDGVRFCGSTLPAARARRSTASRSTSTSPSRRSPPPAPTATTPW